MPNRLKDESSPYLRQHQENPVDWLPWGAEAFTRAKQEDKPILLSIGYSACHWCHVMAHESFEDAETAAQMNRDFINIKVDREEHPDVDQVYQHSLQLFDARQGGWPLTMFLLPSGEPFFGGTYFPPHDNYGRPSFRRVLSATIDAYKNKRGDVAEQSRKLVEALIKLEARGQSAEEPSRLPPDIAERVASRLAMRIDRKRGGFEGAPKFPTPTALSLFLRAFGRSNERDREIAMPTLLTLSNMAAGGIYDHLGGGFARYSTDADWLVPHFEKMLYDNAQLIRLYAEAQAVFRELKRPEAAMRFSAIVYETHGWLEREMRDPAGGFYAAQDADSEGVEGKYFVFSPEDVEAVLDPASAKLFCRCYDIRPGGNWNDPHGHGPKGKSIPHVVDGPDNDEDLERLAAAADKLLAARRERVPPGTDDKILCGWNGLVIAGLAEAGRLLVEPELVAAAQRTADFVLSRMRDPDGRLLRTFKAGVAKLPATLDDHAFLAEGLFYLASASCDLSYLARMRELTDALLQNFYDAEKRLFFSGPEESAGVRLPTRPVSLHDTAIPSGLSVACMNLLRLAALLDVEDPGRERYQSIAEKILLGHADQAMRNPFALSNLAAAMDLLQKGLTTVVIIEGELGSGQELVKAAAAYYVPDVFVVVSSANHPLPAGFSGLIKGKTMQFGKPTAYVCRGQRCTAPITAPEELKDRLPSF